MIARSGIASMLADKGRGTDDEVAHMTSGEMVIPRELQHPGIKALFAKHARMRGKDWREFVVGSPKAKINPMTNLQEFEFGTSEDRGYSGGENDGRDFGGRDGGDSGWNEDRYTDDPASSVGWDDYGSAGGAMGDGQAGGGSDNDASPSISAAQENDWWNESVPVEHNTAPTPHASKPLDREWSIGDVLAGGLESIIGITGLDIEISGAEYDPRAGGWTKKEPGFHGLNLMDTAINFSPIGMVNGISKLTTGDTIGGHVVDFFSDIRSDFDQPFGKYDEFETTYGGGPVDPRERFGAGWAGMGDGERMVGRPEGGEGAEEREMLRNQSTAPTAMDFADDILNEDEDEDTDTGEDSTDPFVVTDRYGYGPEHIFFRHPFTSVGVAA